MGDKRLYIIRGIPGAGKSTLGKELVPEYCICEADQFFIEDGEYKFNPSLIGKAHSWCFNKVENLMKSEYATKIVVSNTFTTESEIQPYTELAEKYGYDIVSIIMERRHNSKSIHNVPEETLVKMVNRFAIKL